MEPPFPLPSRRARMAQQRARQLLSLRGSWILYRSVRRLSGPDPNPNPPSITGPLVVSGDHTETATTLVMSAPRIYGHVRAGDKFKVGGNTVVAVGQAVAAANVLSVPLSSPLGVALSSGTAITPEWSGDKMVKAVLGPVNVSLVDGQLLQLSDLYVTVSAEDVPEPKAQDNIRLTSGEWRTVIPVTREMVDGIPILFRFGAR